MNLMTHSEVKGILLTAGSLGGNYDENHRRLRKTMRVVVSEIYSPPRVTAAAARLADLRIDPGAALDVTTVVLTMYDGRTKLADQVAMDVRAHFGDKVLRTVIPRSVKVSEAPGYGMTILDYDPGSRGAMSYLDASREIAERQ